MQISSPPPRLERNFLLQVRRAAAARIDIEWTIFFSLAECHTRRQAGGMRVEPRKPRMSARSTAVSRYSARHSVAMTEIALSRFLSRNPDVEAFLSYFNSPPDTQFYGGIDLHARHRDAVCCRARATVRTPG